MKTNLLKMKAFLIAIFFAFSSLLLAQSPDFLMSGDYNPPSSWSTAAAMSASAGTSKILISTPSGTGNKYFRFYSAATGGTSYGPSGGSDIALTSGTSSALQNGSSFAYYLNIANAASNVVFKTWGSGSPGSSSAVAFEVQGTVRQVTTVTQSTAVASVVAGQAVTVTATLDGAFASGQAAYLRYSTDNFSTSAVVSMAGSGTSYTASIPPSANTSGTTVKYYVFTSTSVSANVLANGSNADNFTINLNNNSGSNYSYTVNTPGTIYLHNFGTTSISSVPPYTVAPNTFAANLSSSSWTNTGSTNWSGLAGNGGGTSGALSTNTGNNIYTLTFNVASGFQLSVSSFNFWANRSTTGPTGWSMTINGIAVGSGTTPSGATLGTATVTNAVAGLTGTVTVVLSLTGGSGTGTFRLDDFTLNGNVVAVAPAVAPTITSIAASSPGSGTSGYVGNTVTVTGTGFTGVSSVKVGGSAGTAVTPFTVVDDSHITYAATDLSGTVYVSNSAGNATSTASYTTLGYITTATGTWQTAGTWLGGAVPPSAATTNVTIAHNVTGTTGTIAVGVLKVNSGVALTNTSGATINLNAASTNSGTFANNGTLQLNANSSISAAPVYGAASTLVYNAGNYNVGAEWITGTAVVVGTGVPQNVTVLSGTVNTVANKALAGNLVISASSILSLGGDLFLGGNWTDAGTFTPNSKAVSFSGTGATQTITNSNAASSSTETFNYLIINNSNASGVVKLLSNVVISSTAGNVLQLTNTSSLDLAGKTLALSGDGGNILASGGVRNMISSTTGGVLSVTGNKVVTSASSGSLVLGTTANPSYLTTDLTKGLNFGSGNLTTVNGILQVKTNGFVDVNTPKYSNTSTLVYNGVTGYNVNIEWIGNSTTAGIGIPQNVTLISSSVNMPNTARGMAGTLNIGTGSTLNLNTTVGADLALGGNFTNSGTFNANSRLVTFAGTSAQTITGATIFDYLTLSNSLGLTLGGTTSSVVVNNTLGLTSGKITLGSNNLTVSNTGTISGGTASSYMVTNGTGQLKQTVGSAAVAFPVGSATRYNPIILTNAGTSDIYGIILTSGTVPNVNDAAVTVDDRWLVSEAVSGGSNLTVVPQWNTADLNNATGFNAGAQLYIGFYNGSAWTQNAAALSGSNPYTATGAAAFAPANLTTGTQYFAVGKDNAFVCGASNVPFSQGFDSVTVPAMPSCWTVQDANVDGKKWTTNNVDYNTSPNSLVYSYSVTNPANDWAYTPGLNLTAGTAYRVSFKYKVGDVAFPEKLKIAYGTSATTRAMTTIADLESLTNTTYSTANYDFVPSVSGVYYIGFNAYSDANMYFLSIDDVNVVVSPPTLLVNGASSASLNFSSNDIGSTVAPQSFSLSGANLTGSPSNITITAPNANFQVSADGVTYASTANVAYSSPSISATNIYVKYIPTSCGVSSSANVTLSGGGVTSLPTVAVSGTAVLAKPVNLSATDITATTFTANWDVVSGATGYVVDVSTSPTFGTVGTATSKEDFESANVPSAYSAAANYNLVTGTWNLANAGYFGTASNNSTKALQLRASSGVAISPTYNAPSTVTFWAKIGTTLTMNKIVGGVTTALSYTPTVSAGAWTQYTSNINETNSAVQIQFVNGSGLSFLEDVSITYSTLVPSFVSPYNNYPVGNVTSTIVSGLTPNTQYYYRVRATDGSCQSSNSSTVSVTTNSTVVWNGSAWSNATGPTAALDSRIIGLYNVAASFETNNMEVTSTGSLDIQANKDVTVNGNITLPSDGKIILESDANLVQKNAGADNNSNQKITVKRTALLPTKGYTFWSSPVTGQNLYSFSNGYNQALGTGTGTPWNRFFVYKESTDTFVTAVSGEITLSSTSDFAAGRGYAIKGKNSYTPTGGTGTEVPGGADTFVFDGKMNNGPVSSQALKNSCGAAVLEENCTKGYNLIGNPYPSNLDFDVLYTANNAKIYGTAYFWTNNDISATASQSGSGYSGNNYAVYNLTGGTPAVLVDPFPESANLTPNGTVKVGQGFIVKATKAGAGSSLDFTNAMRLGYDADAHFYNAKKPTKNRFWIKMTTPSNIVNTALVGYISGATDGFEINYDGELFVVGSDAFYSTLSSRKLIIQGKAEFINDDIVPLGLKYAANGNYKISLGDKEGIFGTDQKIYLKDKITNTYTDLTSQDYVFSAVKGVEESRFEIVYKNLGVLGTDASSKSDFTVYRDGEAYVILSSKSLGKVEIFDTSGRLLITSSTIEKSIRIDVSAFANGIYIVKAENSGNVKTKKIIK